MKILAISGSSRDKHTNKMIKTVLSQAADFEIIKLKDYKINHCTNCKACHQSFNCVINDDMTDFYGKLNDADLLILASPTYFSNVSGIMKNFMDRCLPYYFSGKLKNKKTILLTCGGFASLIEYDNLGKCKWCQEDECQKSVEACLKNMQSFCHHLDLNVIGQVGAIHGNPQEKDMELRELGVQIKKFNNNL